MMRSFRQAMVFPTLCTLGFGNLLFAQDLSLMDASYAAPAPATSAKPAAVPIAGGSGAPSSASPSSSPKPGGNAATSTNELGQRAVEVSGREDPFLALVPAGGADVVKPLPLGLLPGGRVSPGLPATPPPPKPSAAPATPAPPPPQPTTGGQGGRTPPPGPIGLVPGESPPTVEEPNWFVRGVISTGRDLLTILENPGGDTVQARIGDVLTDGSQVLSISSQRVVFYKRQRRFTKTIGGG